MKKQYLKKDGDCYIDEEGCSWDHPYDWLFIGILGGCGCGSEETLREIAFEVLESFSEFERNRYLITLSPSTVRKKLNEDLTYEVIAHWMDDKQLTEHGGSVLGSWLTEEGEEIYKNIKDLLK